MSEVPILPAYVPTWSIKKELISSVVITIININLLPKDMIHHVET